MEVRMRCWVMVVRLVRVGEGPGRVAWRHTVHLAQGVWLNTCIYIDHRIEMNKSLLHLENLMVKPFS